MSIFETRYNLTVFVVIFTINLKLTQFSRRNTMKVTSEIFFRVLNIREILLPNATNTIFMIEFRSCSLFNSKNCTSIAKFENSQLYYNLAKVY